MSDVIYPNFDLASSNNSFSAIWKLTRAMKKAGWTYKASGDGTSKDTTGTATSDLWGGAVDPSSDSNPIGNTTNAWWCASGPITIKLPIIAAPTGQFIRGEKVTQATSSAEGELVGFDFDGTSSGHFVLLPRVGTFDNTHVVTGSVSGATFTPNGTLLTFIPEIVFFKSTDTLNGSIYLQRVANEIENSSRFSVLATSGGCTATVAPGGSGSGNTFPTIGSFVGLGAQNGSPSHSNWFNTTTNLGKAQIGAVNCTTSTGVSADGTFWVMVGNVSTASSCEFIGYFRCDNSEDADIDPFAWFHVSGIALNNPNARTDSTSGSSFNGATNSMLYAAGTTSAATWRGWRRRGFASADNFISYQTAILCFGTSGNSSVLSDNNANPESIACAYSTKRLREQFVLVSQDNTLKGRKGSPRWLSIVQGGTTFDTYDAKQKVAITAFTGSSPSILVGPYDGTTTPLQS